MGSGSVLPAKREWSRPQAIKALGGGWRAFEPEAGAREGDAPPRRGLNDGSPADTGRYTAGSGSLAGPETVRRSLCGKAGAARRAEPTPWHASEDRDDQAAGTASMSRMISTSSPTRKPPASSTSFQAMP